MSMRHIINADVLTYKNYSSSCTWYRSDNSSTRETLTMFKNESVPCTRFADVTALVSQRREYADLPIFITLYIDHYRVNMIVASQIIFSMVSSLVVETSRSSLQPETQSSRHLSNQG